MSKKPTFEVHCSNVSINFGQPVDENSQTQIDILLIDTSNATVRMPLRHIQLVLESFETSGLDTIR